MNLKAHNEETQKEEGHVVPHIISLGAGVQSSTMALMAAAGEITPMPIAAIFADTQAEPREVYDWLNWLEKQLPFPVHRVTKGNLGNDSVRVKVSGKSGNRYIKGLIPAFIHNRDGTTGLLGRKCTADYKVEQIIRHSRTLCDWKRGEKRHLVTMWVGISYDEITRMKASRARWIVNRFPLVERRIRRTDCLKWMAAHGYPEPPRSACTFCPFHSDDEWVRLMATDARSEIIEFERRLHTAMSEQNALKGMAYLHRDCVPIDEVNFRPDSRPSHAQDDFGFVNECEGMCGV